MKTLIKKHTFVFDVTLTWSKIMAAVIIICSYTLDLLYDKRGTVFMYAIPFAVFLITGKQVTDRLKEKDK